MNIGNKIKNLREEKNISIQEFADLVNDTVENIIKYENNELEPALDKKLAIANILEITLDELMYHNVYNKKETIDQSILSRYSDEDIQDNRMNEEKEIDENSIEEIIGHSSIEFTEKVFDSIFVGRGRSILIDIFWAFAYLVSIIFFAYNGETFFAIIMGVLGVFTFFPTLLKRLAYRKAKKEWLNVYGGKKRQYIFYQNYLLVQEDNEILNTFFYKDFQTIIEQENYFVGMIVQEGNQGLIVVIEKSGFGEGEYQNVKLAIQKECTNFVEETPRSNPSYEKNRDISHSKQTNSNHKLNIILWVFVFLSVFSMSIIRFFSNIITGGDETLKVNLIVNGLSLVFPILSIFLGLISEIKYKQRSRKNIWFALIMIIFCLVQMISSISNHLIYVDKNDFESYNQLETLFEIDLPDQYYTIYTSNNEQTVTIGEVEYKQIDYQLLHFLKASEIKKLDEIVKNNWKETNNQSSYYNVDNVIQSELKKMRIDLSGYESYYTFKENSDGEIIYLFYFEKLASIVAVTYTK